MTNITAEVIGLESLLKLGNYSVSTRKSYSNALRRFLVWQTERGGLGSIGETDIKAYLVWLCDEGRGWQTINAAYSSIKKYVESVLGQSWNVKNLPRPRAERVLPRLLSKSKINHLISSCYSLRDQTFICLLYGTGLRIGEAVGVEVIDIDGDRKKLLVKRGKGNKDRYVDIPGNLLELLRHYYKQYRPSQYLFYGEVHDKALAIRTAQHIIKRNCKRAGFASWVFAHTFRHCYATHHLEGGTNIVYLQQQLGHANLKTTARYIQLLKEHTWRINHPLASMSIEYRPRIR